MDSVSWQTSKLIHYFIKMTRSRGDELLPQSFKSQHWDFCAPISNTRRFSWTFTESVCTAAANANCSQMMTEKSRHVSCSSESLPLFFFCGGFSSLLTKYVSLRFCCPVCHRHTNYSVSRWNTHLMIIWMFNNPAHQPNTYFYCRGTKIYSEAEKQTNVWQRRLNRYQSSDRERVGTTSLKCRNVFLRGKRRALCNQA